MAVTGLLLGCRVHKVDTWEEWCMQLEGRTPQNSVVTFDEPAIRRDFVNRFNSLLVAGIANKYLDGAQPDDQVVQELARLRMIGAWVEGTTLHVANSLMLVDSELGLDEFAETKHEWAHLLAPTTLRTSLTPEQGCLAGTINGVFDRLTLHGPGKATATIPARHTLGRK